MVAAGKAAANNRFGVVHNRANTAGTGIGSGGRAHHYNSQFKAGSNGQAGAGANSSNTPRGGFEGAIAAPWRKTVSIFKQPVTLVHTTSRQTKATPSNDPKLITSKNKNTEKPKQVFWAKRLEGMRAMRPICEADLRAGASATNSEETVDGRPDVQANAIVEQTTLPSRIQPLGPDIDEVSAVASLNASLSNTSPHCHPVMGQTNPKRNLDLNIAAYVHADQPLMQAVVVQDADITAQEKRVLDARRRLEELRKHFG